MVRRPMMMLILLVPAGLMGLLLGMERLERWTVEHVAAATPPAPAKPSSNPRRP